MTQKPWLKFYDAEVPPDIEYDGSAIPSLLEKSSQLYARQTALDFFGFTLTYGELWREIEQFTQVLHKLGLAKGDRVALFLPNCPHFVVTYFAALRLGAVIVPTNPLYSEKELEFQIRDSGAETLITIDLLYPKVYKVRPSTGLKHIIVGKIQDYLPPLKKFIYPIIAQKGTENVPLEEKNGVLFYHNLKKSSAPEFSLPEVAGDALAILQYTGGTTGIAKGAMLTHKNIVVNNIMIRHWYTGLSAGKEIFISVLPFFHTYGMATALNLPLSAGASMVIFPKFVAKDILKAIDSHKATVLPGIPTIYSVLGNFRDIAKYTISTIRFCISGAAPLPGPVLHDFERLTGGIIIEGYGLSEASPVTHCNPLSGKRKDGSIGLPVPATDCKIVDMETGQDLPQGSPGELCIRGPQVMQGYWNRPGETAATLRDGITLCKKLRADKFETPIIMLTAKTSVQDKVTGLDAGANDYLTKPFAFEELLARMRVLLRRSVQPATQLQVADLVLDLLSHKVTRADREIVLSSREFALLEYLMRNAGAVVTRTMISEHVWDIDFDTSTNVIDVYINYLRNKVDVDFDKKLIQTIRGRGYTLKD